MENLGVVSQQLFLPLSQTASWEIVFRCHTTTQYPEYLQGRWHHHTLNPHTRLEWDLVSQCYWLCSWKVLWKHQAKASKQHQVLPLLCFFYCSWLPGLPLLQLHLLSLGSTTFIPLLVFFISLYSDIAKKITPFKAVLLRYRVWFKIYIYIFRRWNTHGWKTIDNRLITVAYIHKKYR